MFYDNDKLNVELTKNDTKLLKFTKLINLKKTQNVLDCWCSRLGLVPQTRLASFHWQGNLPIFASLVDSLLYKKKIFN